MKKTIIWTLISLLLLNSIFVYKWNANDNDLNWETKREEHEILIEDVDWTIISLESEPTEKILNDNNENEFINKNWHEEVIIEVSDNEKIVNNNISIVKENNNNFWNAPTKNFQLKDDPRVKVLGSENTINNNIKINDNLKLKIDKIEVEIPELEEQIQKIYEAINLFIKINGIK